MSAAGDDRILLPGMDGTGLGFAPLCRVWGSGVPIRVVAYPDRPDFQVAAATEHVRTVIPVGGRSVLVAESYSGPIAIRVASAGPPPALRALVLVATFAAPPFRVLARAARTVVGAYCFSRPMLSLGRRLLDGGNPRPGGDETWPALQRVSRETLAARMRAVMRVDEREAAARITVPTLVIGALRDRIVPRREIRRLASGIPNARLAWLDGPHRLLQNEPERAAEEIDRFLATLSPGRARGE